METSDSASLTLIDDVGMRDIPDSQLAARMNSLLPGLRNCVEVAIASARQSVFYAIAVGQVCEIAMQRHEGAFTDWLFHNVARDENGEPMLSESTARKYRTLWKKRDLLFPPDDGAPAPRNITEAYQKLGLLPEPDQAERDPNAVQPLFRVHFTLPSEPPEKWPAAEKRVFLEKTQPIADLREKLLGVGG